MSLSHMKHMCTGIYLYRHALYRLEDIRLAGVNSRMMLYMIKHATKFNALII